MGGQAGGQAGRRIVADSSVFIVGKVPEGDVMTVPGVEEEMKDLRSKSLLQISGVRVERPSSDALKRARSIAEGTGDIRVLSETDLEVLALALEHGAEIATDDYAIQNSALQAGLKVIPIALPVIRRKVRRVQKCYACGSPFEGESCPDCGTPVRTPTKNPARNPMKTPVRKRSERRIR